MYYNLFISHSWNYSDAYEKLVDLLDNHPYFSYRNYSVPRQEALIIRGSNYRAQLKSKIRNQMYFCNVIIILSGVYASYSNSIQLEIEVAQELVKPIIAIAPWGADKTSSVVNEAADTIVRWNTSSIVDAIRAYSN